jgi:hypothetical protein
MAETRDYFSGLVNDTSFGRYNLPSLDQYDSRINELRGIGVPEEAIAVSAQRDWHSRGQNGCNFARIAARRAIELGWHSEHIGSQDNLGRVDDVMRESVENPEHEIVSLLFNFMSPRDLASTLISLTEAAKFYLEKDELIDEGARRQLFLRYPLAFGKIASWSMCFAPYDFMPNTRRSPFIEIATRVKEKPEGLHPLLNGNSDEAHLADLIIDKDPKHTGHRIAVTVERTASILGEKPNHITAAKSTLVVPIDQL